MVQYNDFRKQVAENEKKAWQNLQDKDTQLAQLQQELQDAKHQAEQQAKDLEQCVRNAASAKENELSALMAEHCEKL